MRLATLSDGTNRRTCVRRYGRWHQIADGDGAEREAILTALDDPSRTDERAGPAVGDDFRPVMPFRPLRDVFCLGKNFRAHAEEFSRFSGDQDVVPQAPIVFTKSAEALCGPTDPLTVDAELAHALDYEAELAIIIGRGGDRISLDEALGHVAAYSVINDTTARDLQRTHAQWYLGKSLRAATPWGPVLVSPDELGSFPQRAIGAAVNGEPRQGAVLGEMIVSVPEAIASISRVVALERGDIIAMGTPSGVGAAFDPPRFLGDGDEVTCWVDGIGELCNRVAIRRPADSGARHD